MTFSQAVKFITTEINKDSNKQLVYIANITYAIENEYWRYCKEHYPNKRYPTSADIHAIAKKAAKHFIDMWLLNADKEG